MMRGERPSQMTEGRPSEFPEGPRQQEKEFNNPIGSPRGSEQAGQTPDRWLIKGQEQQGASRFSARIMKKDSTDFC